MSRVIETLAERLGIGPFNDWHVAIGARLPRGALVLMIAGAVVALALSAVTVIRDRRPRGAWIVALRAGALAACLGAALQPTLALRQVTKIPNRVAVLVDASRSMDVRPPNAGPSRAERAAQLWARTQPLRSRWEAAGHRLDLYTFGEGIEPATEVGLAARPAADATRIGEALAELRARYAGRDLGAVVVVSDGIDTGRIGKGPLDAETRATIESLRAPVHTVGVGEAALRDLAIANVLADEIAFVRTPITIEAVIRQSGLSDRRVDVTLTRDGRPVDVRTVLLSGETSEQTVSFDWVPDQPGNFVFEVSTPVVKGEALDGNNAQVFTVKVIRDRIRVLHVCGRPSWDQRFLRAMLRRDPNVDLVSFFILRTETDEQPWNRNELSLIPFPTYEIFDEQLRSFDLVIFQNFNYAPYGVEPFLSGIRDYVEGGGALAMIGGELSFASGGYGATPLREVLPVEMSASGGAVTTDLFKPRLTNEGRVHPVTSLLLDPKDNEARWAKLPALEGINRVLRLRSGAVPLLVHPGHTVEGGKPAPVAAVTEVGRGRTLAMLTDSAWHWGFAAAGEGDDGRAFQRFWENAIRWLVRDPALTLLRLDLDRLEYRRQQSPALRVRTMHADYSPAREVKVAIDVFSTDDAEQGAPKRSLTVTTDNEGEGFADVGALPPGAYRLLGKATVDGRVLEEVRTFVVRREARELADVTYRDRVLREIADVGGGTFREDTFDGVSIAEPREVRVGSSREVALWSSPFFLLIALGLLLVEWTLRRRAGYR